MSAPPSDSDATRYVSTVLTLYLGLPETPLRPSAQDRSCARDLYDRSVQTFRKLRFQMIANTKKAQPREIFNLCNGG